MALCHHSLLSKATSIVLVQTRLFLKYDANPSRFRCDVYLGSPEDGYSARTFSINLDKNGDLLLNVATKNNVAVKCGGTYMNRTCYSWRFFADQTTIKVKVADKAEFKISWPEHVHREAYEVFRDSYILSMDETKLDDLNWSLAKVRSRMETKLLTGEATPRNQLASFTQSRWQKGITWKPLRCLGYGGLGQVVLAQRMNNGDVRVCKNLAQKATSKDVEDSLEKAIRDLLLHSHQVCYATRNT